MKYLVERIVCIKNYKHFIFFSFFFFPLSLDFLCVSVFRYYVWMFPIFILFRAFLWNVPILISALSYWIILYLRFYTFVHLPHSGLGKIFFPYIIGLTVDRILLFTFYCLKDHQVRSPNIIDFFAIFFGVIFLSYIVQTKNTIEFT